MDQRNLRALEALPREPDFSGRALGPASALTIGATGSPEASRRTGRPLREPAELAAFEAYVRRDMPRVNEANRIGRGEWGDFVEPLERHMSALRGRPLRGPQTVLAHVLVNFATRSMLRWGLRQSELEPHQLLAAVPSLVPLLTRLNRSRGFPDRDQCFQTHVLDNVWLYRLGFTEAVLTHTALPGESLFILTLATCSGHAKQARAALLSVLSESLEPGRLEAVARLQTAAEHMSSVWNALRALVAELPVDSFREFRPYNADAVSLRAGGTRFGGASGADDPYLLSLDRMVFAPLPAWYEKGYLPDRLVCMSVPDRRRYEGDRVRTSLLELAMKHRRELEFVGAVTDFVKRYNAAMGVHWGLVVRYLLDPPASVEVGTAQVLIGTVKRLLDMRRGDARLKELRRPVRRSGRRRRGRDRRWQREDGRFRHVPRQPEAPRRRRP